MALAGDSSRQSDVGLVLAQFGTPRFDDNSLWKIKNKPDSNKNHSVLMGHLLKVECSFSGGFHGTYLLTFSTAQHGVVKSKVVFGPSPNALSLLPPRVYPPHPIP